MKSLRMVCATLTTCCVALAACTGTGPVSPNVAVPGGAKSVQTRVLEAGAKGVQRDQPTETLDIYLVGFHPLADDPAHQFEAHHFCRQVNADFMQCALYDGNTPAANLNGVEYIVSERLYARLPQAERRYWHPHNFEILSGQLVAPGLPAAADHALMKGKMNSYGKTWHTWDTSSGGPDALPLGEPRLAWSFNRLGEARDELVATRDRRMHIDSAERRRAREDLRALARPQNGVDRLKGAFDGPTTAIPGVTDRGDGHP